MSNRYEIKVFNNSNEYKSTINPNLIMNDVQLSSSVNGGLGQFSLNIAVGFGNKDFSCGDIVSVILYNERHKQGKQIFLGFVSQISRKMETNREYLTLVVLGIASLLKSVAFEGSTTGTAGNIIRTAISCFNAKYGNILTIGRIENGENITIELQDGATCRTAIDKVNGVQNYFRYVDGEGKFRFRGKRTQKTHILVNGKSVESLTVSTSIEDVCNKLTLEIKDGATKTYQNTQSQNKYGIKEKYISETSIADTTTQDEYGNNYISENKDPKDATSITVNDSYEIESIEPGDFVSVVNSEYEIKNLIVEKIKLTPTKATLTIEENETLRDVISK